MKPHANRHTHRPLPTQHMTCTGDDDEDDGAGGGGDVGDVRWRRNPVVIHSILLMNGSCWQID